MSVVGANVRMTDCMDREHRRRKGLIFTSHGSAIRTSRRFAMKGIFHRTTRQHVRALAMSLLLSATTFGTARLNAQSCAVPFQWQPDVTLPGFSNTTCGGPHVADSFCDNQFDNPGPNFVVQFFLHPTTSEITLSGGDSGFGPVMYLSDSLDGCSGGLCVASGDTGIPMQVGGLPSGTYYLTVAARSMDAPGSCGGFTLSMNGDFSGGDDVIFANGFE
jgi:hypothetical protein